MANVQYKEICLTCYFWTAVFFFHLLYTSPLMSQSLALPLCHIFPTHKYFNLHVYMQPRVKQKHNSCFLLLVELLFLHFIPLRTPPPHCPPLGICFCSSEEAHASSAWTQQQLSVPSTAKHVRRCLLEVALAQVSTST